MARKLIPTDSGWVGGEFWETYENSSNQLRLGDTSTVGTYTSPVLDAGSRSGLNRFVVTNSGGGTVDKLTGITGSQGAQIRCAPGPPQWFHPADDFGSADINSNLWTVVADTNAVYGQSNGLLNVKLANSAGDKFRLRWHRFSNIHQTGNDEWGVFLHLRPSVMTESTSISLFVGLQLGSDSDSLSNVQPTAFAGLEVSGTTTQYRGWSGTADYAGGDMSLPTDIWFAFYSPNNSGNIITYYRLPASDEWTQMTNASVTVDQSRYLELVFEVVAAGTGGGEPSYVVDVDVDEFMIAPWTEITPADKNNEMMWRPGDMPGQNDPNWAPVLFVDNFSSYTNGLDVSGSGTYYWSEGVNQGGDLETALKHPMHQRTSSALGEASATVNKYAGYTNASWDSGSTYNGWNSHQYTLLNTGNGLGFDQPLWQGTVGFTWYMYRSADAFTSDNWLMYITGYSSVTAANQFVLIAKYQSPFRWILRGPLPSNYRTVGSTWGYSFSGGNSWTYHLQLYWDMELKKAWFWNTRPGSKEEAFSHPAPLSISSSHGYTVEGSVDPGPVTHIYVTFLHNGSGAFSSEQRLYWPTVRAGRFPPACSYNHSMDYTYDRDQLPWSWSENNVTDDSNYFDRHRGRYAQYRLQLNDGA